MPSNSPKASSFEPFPRLPLELRRKIWSFALISYPAQTFRLETRKRAKPRGTRLTTIHATGPQPAICHASQEARLESLRYFSQIPTTREYTPLMFRVQNYALVNFSIDVFVVEGLEHIPYNPSASLKQIQLLRTTVKHLLFFGSDLIESSLSSIDGLREVEFTLTDQDSRYEEEERVERMVDAFDWVRKEKQDWIFPKVKIVENGVVSRVYEGGAWNGEA